MSAIKSYELLNKIYKCLQGQGNQGLFIIKFFVAAGCTNYYLPKAGTKLGTKDLEGPRHYIKDRSLTDIKTTFPDPINKKEAAEYLLTSFDKNKVRAVMDEFGIPSDAPENNKAFAYSVVEQFSLYFGTDEEDIDCFVAQEFSRYAAMSDAEIVASLGRTGSLVNGDYAYLAPYNNEKHHYAECHQTFKHVWNIQNSGRTIWSGRKLVLVNQAEIRPRALSQEIAIPEVKPGESITLEVEFETRGFEGEFEAKWEMRDSAGQSCFDTISNLFNFNITVHYQMQKIGG